MVSVASLEHGRGAGAGAGKAGAPGDLMTLSQEVFSQAHQVSLEPGTPKQAHQVR